MHSGCRRHKVFYSGAGDRAPDMHQYTKRKPNERLYIDIYQSLLMQTLIFHEDNADGSLIGRCGLQVYDRMTLPVRRTAWTGTKGGGDKMHDKVE